MQGAVGMGDACPKSSRQQGRGEGHDQPANRLRSTRQPSRWRLPSPGIEGKYAADQKERPSANTWPHAEPHPFNPAGPLPDSCKALSRWVTLVQRAPVSKEEEKVTINLRTG